MDTLASLFAATAVLAAVVMTVAAARVALRVHEGSRVQWWVIGGGLALSVVCGIITIYNVAGSDATGDQLWRSATMAVVFSAVAAGFWRLVPALAGLSAAQQTLHAHDYLLAASDGIGDTGYWQWERATNTITHSEETARIFGVLADAATFDAEAFLAQIAAGDRERVGRAIDRATTERYDLRYRIATPQGWRTIEEHAVPIVEDGETVRVVGVVRDVTAELAAAQALHDSEQRLRTIFDHSSAGLVVLRGDHTLMVNDAFARMVGYERDELIGEGRLIMLVHPDEQDATRARAQQVLATGSRGEPVARRLVTKSGVIIHTEGRAVPIQVPDGDDALLIESWDVTERVLAEQALAESEERFRAVFDGSPTGITVVDYRDGSVHRSPAFARMLGYTPEEFATMDHSRFMLPDRRSSVTAFVADLHDGAATPRGVRRTQFVRKDGALCDVEFQVSELTIDQQRIGTVTHVRDVSEQLAAQRALTESEGRFCGFVETMRSGLVLWSPSGEVEFFNPAVAAIFGYSEQEFVRLHLTDLYPQERRARVMAMRQRRLAGDGPPVATFRLTMLAKDGRTVEVDGAVSVFERDGEVVGSLAEYRDVTAEVEAERALIESKEHLNTVLETVRSGLVIVDLDRNFLTVNQAAADLFGYSRQELLESTIADVVGGDEVAQVAARFEARKSGVPGPEWLRTPARRKDGTTFDLELRSAPFIREGQPPAVLAELRDVTEENALRRALERSEAHLRTVVDTTRAGLVIAGADQRPVWFNEAACEILGYDREQFAQLTLDRAVHPDDYPGLSELFAMRLAGTPAQDPTIRVRMQRADDETIVAEVSAAPFVIDGQTNGVLAEFRDITAEVRGEEALRESEERNRVIVDSIAVPLTVWDPHGRLLHHNRAVCDLTGYSPSELVTMRAEDFFDDETAKPIVADADAARSGRTPEVRVCQMRRKDGGRRTIALSMAAVEFPGEEHALLVQTIDITAQVEAERHLRQTQKLEAVGTLVSGVAHDFNNLLTAIGGSLELASQELAPSEWLDRARLATDRASDLVQRLLQFSRRQPSRPAIVDLGSLATETVDLVRETTDRRVTFEVAPSSGVNVWADRNQIQQVLMNLLVNARDAVLERLAATDGAPASFRPRIDVTVSRFSTGDEWGELTVTDNGAGMPDDVRERIFDPFFTTKEVDEGTGLGMSIVFAIVTDHSGAVTVESAPDRGTSVRVQLPAAIVVAVGAAGEGDAAAVAPAGPARPREQGAILIVDDEPTITEFAQSVLSRAGYDVVSTTNGDDALMELLHRPYDLLLLDVNMPAPNGWQVLHEALTLNPEQCIMMLSGFALEEEARERGAAGLIQKPFNGSTLIERVAEALRDRTSTERSAVEV